MSKNRSVLTVVSVVLALLLLFDLFMLFYFAGIREQPHAVGGGIQFDPTATDERPNQGHGTSQGVTVAGFSVLTIPPDLDTVPIDLYNPIDNSGLYYMTFELRLLNESERSYEVLFTTGYVAPGKHIYQVTLAHGMPAGEYTAQLLIQPYRMQDLSPTNNVSATIKLNVK